MTNDEAHEIFSKRVTQTRIDRELSQLDVADNLGISVSTYQNYERGRRDIPYDILIDLADVLGVSIDYLFGRRQGLGSAFERVVMNDNFFTTDEKALLCAYVKMSPSERIALQTVFKNLCRHFSRMKDDILSSQPEASLMDKLADLQVRTDRLEQTYKKRIRSKSKRNEEQ